MILDTVRMVADWLNDATYGVNAVLAAVDLDGTDSAPAGTYTIQDETRDDDAAINRDGTPPLIRVTSGDLRSLDGQSATYTHDADISTEITIVRDATSPAAVVRDCYYTARAVAKSVESLFGTSATAATARVRNGVQAYAITNLSTAAIRVDEGDRPATLTVFLTVRVRDLNA